MAGTVVWSYFSNCFNATSTTFITNAAIFGKVYFPRLVMPISVVITRFFMFLIQFGLFIGFYAYFLFKGAPLRPNLWIVCLPVLLLQMAFLGLGSLSLALSLGQPEVAAYAVLKGSSATAPGVELVEPVAPAVAARALAAGLPVFQPERLRRPEAVSQLADLHPDLIVVAAYAQILSRRVLALPRFGCLNVNPSRIKSAPAVCMRSPVSGFSRA